MRSHHGASHSGSVITMGGETRPTEDDEDEGEAIKPLPERLVIELTAHRTLALRDAVANNPRIAMTALLHKLVSTASAAAASGRQSRPVREIHLPVQAADLADSYPGAEHRRPPRRLARGHAPRAGR
jgi:ParB family chromosome partitioning protein